MKRLIYQKWSMLLWGMLSLVVIVAGCKDDDENNVGIVPHATSIAPNEGVRPGDVIVISGADLDQVKQLRFGAAYLLDSALFDPATNASQIVFAMPDNAPGGEVYMVSLSETVPNVLAGSIKMIVPVINAVSPSEVKAGTVVTITGADLNLVLNVMIGTVYLYDVSVNEDNTVLTAVCPDDITAGKLKLIQKNGNEVEYETLLTTPAPIETPVIGAVSDAFVGGKMTITGASLDLVTSIVFPENIVVSEFVSQTGFKIEVTVPATATTGNIKIKLVTPDVDVESGSVKISGVDPAQYVFIDFDDKTKGWNDIGDVVSNADLSFDGTKFYEVNKTVTGDWATYFADNTAGRLNLNGVSVDGYAVVFDVNIIEIGADVVLKLRLGEYWYVWKVGEAYAGGTLPTGWIKVSAPLSEFKNEWGNGTALTNEKLNDPTVVNEWALTAGWGGGKVHMRVDNMGFDLMP